MSGKEEKHNVQLKACKTVDEDSLPCKASALLMICAYLTLPRNTS